MEDTPGEDVVVATTIPASTLTPEGGEDPKTDGSEGTKIGDESNANAPTGGAQAPQTGGTPNADGSLPSQTLPQGDAQTGGTL